MQYAYLTAQIGIYTNNTWNGDQHLRASAWFSAMVVKQAASEFKGPKNQPVNISDHFDGFEKFYTPPRTNE